jgi:uncharacterized membrane protein YbjE (DUF340 family)
MLEILALMFAGTLAGYLIRKRQVQVRLLEKGILWSIFLLLFLLGLSIGSNDEVMRQLPVLGGQAFLLSLGGVGGSLLFAFLAWRFLFKKEQKQP